MIFLLFLLSLIAIQRILSTTGVSGPAFSKSVKPLKLNSAEPPVSDPLISPNTTEHHQPTSLLNLSHAIEQNTPVTTTHHAFNRAGNSAVKNTAQ